MTMSRSETKMWMAVEFTTQDGREIAGHTSVFYRKRSAVAEAKRLMELHAADKTYRVEVVPHE
jgi:hypothetical protein